MSMHSFKLPVRLNPFISSDECLSDASSTNHEDILSDGSTTLSPLSDIEYDYNFCLDLS